MPIRRLKDWMPRPDRPHRKGARSHTPLLDQRLQSEFNAVPLDPQKALETWMRLVDKVRYTIGVDLARSEASFVWEAWDTEPLKVPFSTRLVSPKGAFALLIEDAPEEGYILEIGALTLTELKHLPDDLCLVAWPRLNFLAMLSHEPGFGPYLLPLKKGLPPAAP